MDQGFYTELTIAILGVCFGCAMWLQGYKQGKNIGYRRGRAIGFQRGRDTRNDV
jgi:hypothetical protein